MRRRLVGGEQVRDKSRMAGAPGSDGGSVGCICEK